MNPITIGMDVLLALLLLAALWMGARLNGRLKALKESHQGFAIAVQTLDAAAAKADAALKALHAASEDTHDSLLARIETARALTLKLEKASETADKASARAEDAASNMPAAAPAPSTTPRRSLSELLAGRTPIKTSDPEARPEPRAVAPPLTASPPLMAPARRRPVADEDLFAEAEADVRPALSGLMRMSLARAR